MKCYLLVLSFLCTIMVKSQTVNDTWSVRFSNAMIHRYSPTINALTSKGWEYSNTIITHGMEKVYNNVTDSVKYLNYIKSYVDAYVNASGVISATVNSLDRTHPGISCLFLYEKTGLAKYQTAATTLRNIYVGASATYPKTATGNIFWHKNNGSYNDIILIDGIYMLHPFLAKYGKMFSDNAAIDTAVNQTLFIYNQLYDNTKKLIKHAWNPTKTQAWANATTGNSSEVWSRGMGWYCMALVDILKSVPASHPKRGQLLTALTNLATGIQNYQDPATGLWYQVVDRGTGLAGNYLETSGSAMFVYTIKTAVDSGWISNSFLPVAQNGWNYLKNTANLKIDVYSDGYPRINDFAPAMSVQTSAANYVQVSLQPVDCPGTAHPHGYGAILMAASVMEFPFSLVTLPVRFASFSARKSGTDVFLSWENNDDTEVRTYEVQRSLNGTDFTDIAAIASDRSGKYNVTDYTASGNKLYYRIKAVSLNERTTLSPVVFISTSQMSSFQALPNPVLNQQLSISATGLPKGEYVVKMFNPAGIIQVSKKIVVGNENQFAGTMELPDLPKGVYILMMESPGIRKSQTVLVQ
ncbi:MAG TPA: glycoside hydrolase family 88 protein [Chitinophagaceae bacterium]|nr:glycoside hydrolase family 88 protein [Chitinophagaceae bacterium]